MKYKCARCRGFGGQVVSSISSPPSHLFFSSRIFPFHLQAAVPRNSPAMQIVFCRKTCRFPFAAEKGSATERMQMSWLRIEREGWVVGRSGGGWKRRPRLRKHWTGDLRARHRRRRKIRNSRLHSASLQLNSRECHKMDIRLSEQVVHLQIKTDLLLVKNCAFSATSLIVRAFNNWNACFIKLFVIYAGIKLTFAKYWKRNERND